jgi:hypothetical protein
MARVGSLPNLIIIGARKCATTSLHYYLGLHPEIAMSREKELHFFVAEGNWPRGVGWYRSNFVGEARVHGEASTSYTMFPQYGGVAETMHSVVPEAKLIYLVRDPIERIISDYIHDVAKGEEVRQIAEALRDIEASPYVARSRYAMQLERYMDYFPWSNIMVLASEELHDHRRETLKEVFRFMEVDDRFYSLKFSRLRHPSDGKRRKTALGNRLARTSLMRSVERWPFDIREKIKAAMYFPFSRRIPRPTLEEDLRNALVNYLSDDTNRLRAYTGRGFQRWSV